MAGNDLNQGSSVADSAKDIRDKASAAAKDIGREAAATVQDYREAGSSAAQGVADAARSKGEDLKAQAKGIADDLKETANEHVGEARDLVSNVANEARNKIAEIVDQQKNAGADKLASFSRAAQNAAGDLAEQNPQVARLVRDAASTVDHFAGDLRSSDLSDVVATVSGFARKQPVAFFAAAVLAGFVLARFVKSEPVPVAEENPRRRTARR